jgi:soluble lytic murein transglycosylase-like protein
MGNNKLQGEEIMILNTDSILTLVKSVYPDIFQNNEIPISVIAGQVVHESSGNTKAFRSDKNKGSYGLLQVDKSALPTIGFPTNTDLFNPELNLKVGMTYDKMLYYGKVNNPNITTLSGMLRVACTLVSYNCGPGNFNLMYRNHIKPKRLTTWNELISDANVVANWHSCLAYPVAIFFNAYKYFGLKSEKLENNTIFKQPIVLIKEDL